MSLARWQILFSTLFSVVISILTSCNFHVDPKTAGAAAAAAATGQDYRVAASDKVPLYIFGPQQLSVPDELLNKDTLVRVIKTQLGFTLIQTSEGQVGWVPTEDLTAPPAEVLVGAGLAYEAPSPASTATQSGSSVKKSSSPTNTGTAAVQRHQPPHSNTKAKPTASPSAHH
jgi:hypothetical protein